MGAGIRRLLVLTVSSALALTGLATLQTATALAKRPKHRPSYCTVPKRKSKHHKPLPKCRAKALVRQLRSAHTKAARVAAITSIAGASGIGVYRSNGKQVVGGVEAGPHDLYLYTFQVTSLADQMARGSADYSSFDQEAAVLNALQVTLNGGPVTGPALEAAVAAGLRRLPASSSSPVDALGITVRDLGTARHINWSQPPSSSAAILDPLQRFLILVDITRPIIHAGAKAEDVAGAAQATGDPGAHAAACDGNFTGQASGGLIGGRWALGTFALGKGPNVGIQSVLDGVMGTAFAYSFAVAAVNPHGNFARFGTGGPNSAQPLDFQVKTVMLDDLSSTFINCGTLVGYTVPGKGPLAGTTINWDEGKLPDLGTVTCDSSCTNTNSDGIATLHWQPYDEYLPGQGTLVKQIDTIQANAYPSKGVGNVLGAILEALGITKFAIFAYTVSYHDPGGYKVQIPAFSQTGSENGTTRAFTDKFFNMEACDLGSSANAFGYKGNPVAPLPSLGLSPYPSPASSFVEDETDTFSNGSTVSSPGAAQSHPAAFGMSGIVPFSPQTTDYGWDDANSGGSIGGLNISGAWVFSSPTLQASITTQRQGVSPGSQTFTLPVTQATDCPVGGGPS